MTTFESSAEVRRHLKAAGFTHRVKIKRQSSPFGGRDLFFVEPQDLPADATVVSSGGSREPTRFFSNDPSVVALYAQLQDALVGTNARAA